MALVLKSTWQGKDRVLDLESITSREYKVIKRHTGLKMGEFELSFRNAATSGMDPEVVDCLLWLFLKRDGRDCDPETLDDYAPMAFISSLEMVGTPEDEEDPKGNSAPTISEPSSI